MNGRIRNIVFSAPDGNWVGDRWEGGQRTLAQFYADLLGWQLIREDWPVVAADCDALPRLAFGEGPAPEYAPPELGNPERPQQLHVDLPAPDLDVAERLAGAAPGRVARITIDCFSPRALAAFYSELLGMEPRLDDDFQRAVIVGTGTPDLGFQHPVHVAPRWPDPAYPQQIHLDLHFDDVESGKSTAERLGAMRLRDMGGSCVVFADPAAHPFCICGPGQ